MYYYINKFPNSQKIINKNYNYIWEQSISGICQNLADEFRILSNYYWVKCNVLWI